MLEWTKKVLFKSPKPCECSYSNVGLLPLSIVLCFKAFFSRHNLWYGLQKGSATLIPDMNILPLPKAQKSEKENPVSGQKGLFWFAAWVGSKLPRKYSAVLSLARISKQVNLPCRNTVKQKYNNGIRRQNPPKYRQQLRKVALRHLIHLHWKIFSTGMKVVLPFCVKNL